MTAKEALLRSVPGARCCRVLPGSPPLYEVIIPGEGVVATATTARDAWERALNRSPFTEAAQRNG